MNKIQNNEVHVEYVQGLVGVANTEDVIQEMEQRSIHPSQLLCLAAYCGCSEVVAGLLERGADPNLKSRSGVPALIWAVASGDRVTVAEFAWAGADLDAPYDGAAEFDAWSDVENRYIILRGTPRELWRRLHGYELPL